VLIRFLKKYHSFFHKDLFRVPLFPHRRGVTLIELIVAIGILTMIGSLTITSLGQFRDKKMVDAAVEEVLSAFSHARLDTLSSKNNLAYAVHIDSNQLVYFQGTTYTAGAATNIVYKLPSQVEIVGIVLNGAGTNVLFQRLSGATNQYGAFQVRAKSNPGMMSPITINSTGIVASLLVFDNLPPSVPSGLIATTVSSSQVSLSWTPSTDNVAVSGYNVYRGGAFAGSTGGVTYTDSGLSPGTAYTYTVSAYDALSNFSAESGSVSTTTLGSPPTITTQPLNQSVSSPQTATFSVVAGGSAPFSYQWRKNGVDISGATSASYTTPGTSTGDNGAIFTVVVTNALGSVTSANAILSVNAAIGYWALDDNTGTQATDSSGNNNTGTLTNGPTWTTGRFGKAVNFDGVNDFIDLGAPATFNSLQVPMTITGWFYKTSASPGTQPLFAQYKNSTGHQLIKLVRFSSGVLKYYGSTAGGSYQSFGTLTPSLNTWNFFAVKVAGTITAPVVTITVNGTSESTNFAALSATPDITAKTYIGGDEANSGERFTGKIDDVRIYNSALSTADISALFNAPAISSANTTAFTEGVAGLFAVQATGTPAPALTKSGTLPSGVTFTDNGNGTATFAGTPAGGSAGSYPLTLTATNSSGSFNQNFTLLVGTPPSGLTGYWALNDNTGTQAIDSSGNNNTGTLTNGPTWTTGKIGQSVNFDGSNDFITTTNTTSWDNLFASGVSISAWVKYPNFSTYQRTVTIENNANTDYDIWMQAQSSSAVMQCGFGGGSKYKNGTTVLQANTWYHVVCVTDYTNGGTKIYVNSTDDGGTVNATPTYVADKGSLDIGRLRSGSASSYGSGTYDDVRIYNRALTGAEILQLYSLGN